MSVLAGNTKLVLCLGLVAGACTANPQAKPEVDAAPTKPAAQETAPVVTQAPVVAKGEPALPVTPPVVPETPTVPETPPVVAADGVVTPPVVPVATLPAPVAAEGIEHLTPAWEPVAKLDKEVVLQRLASGVLASVGGVFHELGPDGALVEKPAAEPIDAHRRHHGPVEGQWPDDVWRIKEVMHERTGSDISFMKWRAGGRWVAQADAGTTEWDGEQFADSHWSPRTGFLLVEAHDGVAEFKRLAGKHPAPEAMTFGSGELQRAYESAGGTMFLFVQPSEEGRRNILEVLRSCKEGEPAGCERSGGIVLPPVGEKGSYYVHTMAARNRWSISVGLTATLEPGHAETEDHYLMHYETGGWKLEATPGDRKIGQMLAAPDGSVWFVLDDGAQQSLWHRSDAGKWVAVDLPAELVGAPKIQVALRDPTHVWVAGNVGETHAIHAAPAALQAPVVPVPEPSPAG